MAYTGDRAGSVAAAPFDVARAAAFLQDQAECLAAGLRSVDDPLAVRAVLRSHDGGHDDWLRLIAAVRQEDARAGDVLATLYAFHGRVAGSLEHATSEQGAAAPRDAWAALSQRLEAATAAAVEALHAVDRSLRQRPER